MSRAPIDAASLAEVLEYIPETGVIFFRHRADRWFSSPAQAIAWNARWAGEVALQSVDADGYFFGSVFGRLYKAHRVAFALHTGEWPKFQIDHINGRRQDNRICNLRDVPAAVNQRNKARTRLNTSGVSGVTFCPRKQRWRVRARMPGGAKKSFGSYASIEEATAVRKAAEVAFGYHENHGRSA